MKRVLLIICIAFSLSVVSQVAVFTKQVKMFKIEATGPELETIIKALGTLPYNESASIINSIIGQAQKQLTDTTIKKK